MPSNHTFSVGTRREVRKGNLRSVFILSTDNWDDFSHKVQFHLAFLDKDGVEHEIGTVKILQCESPSAEPIAIARSTKLPGTFPELDAHFISLGQEDDYYKNLHKLFPIDVDSVLVALRDIAWQPILAEIFEPTTAFRNALMRNNGAHRARRFGRAWAQGDSISEHFSFNYIGQVDGAEQPVDAKIEFDDKDKVPGRIVGIIGRNAVGKTRFLANLAEDLAQISRTSAETITKREQRFPEGRPLFTRIIAISYSAFDRFKRPQSTQSSSSYVYCGIRNDRGVLSPTSLMDAYRNNQKRIRELDRKHDWTSYMGVILGDLSTSLTTSLEEEISEHDRTDQTPSILSSGQSILAHFTTALLAWIQPNTLVLFDEPETHLHPNAVASLFVVLTDILRSYDSYAVIATHSPVVIQEIPAKRVIIFRRTGNVTLAEPLPLESFGESVTELTRHLFETIGVDSLYRRTLKALSRQESAEEVLARFEKGLSLSAQAYLLAQYGRSSEGE